MFHVHEKTYDAVKALQLIEYGIKNKASVVKNQRDTVIEDSLLGTANAYIPESGGDK